MKYVWENQAKIKADIYKYLGFAFCSTPGILLLDYIRFNIALNKINQTRILAAIGSLVIGIFFIIKSVNTMRKLDEENLYDKFNKIH